MYMSIVFNMYHVMYVCMYVCMYVVVDIKYHGTAHGSCGPGGYMGYNCKF